MKLFVNFLTLKAAIHWMTPSRPGEFSFNKEKLEDRDPIDVELYEGFELELKEVEFLQGIPIYQGRQIILYIKDHGRKVIQAIEDPEQMGRKFHIFDCKTLREMRSKGRFERYVLTNNTSGLFAISGTHWTNNQAVEENVALKVCKFCLSELNYQGYATEGGINKRHVFAKFTIKRFFSAYISLFRYLPKIEEYDLNEEKTATFNKLSNAYFSENHYWCEGCQLDLAEYPQWLHIHHINGIKSENHFSNLKALCSACHSASVEDAPIFVPRDVKQTLMSLRRKQKISMYPEGWDSAFALVDPALHSVIFYLKQAKSLLPELSVEIKKRNKILGYIDLAWPISKFGIVIHEQDKYVASKHGWHIVSMGEFLENPDKSMACVSA